MDLHQGSLLPLYHRPGPSPSNILKHMKATAENSRVESVNGPLVRHKLVHAQHVGHVDNERQFQIVGYSGSGNCENISYHHIEVHVEAGCALQSGRDPRLLTRHNKLVVEIETMEIFPLDLVLIVPRQLEVIQFAQIGREHLNAMQVVRGGKQVNFVTLKQQLSRQLHHGNDGIVLGVCHEETGETLAR